METGYPNGIATLVSLSDGTTSLTDSDVPVTGHVIIRALTYQGRYQTEAPEDDLGHGHHPLSSVFYAGHDVLTELRTIDEAKRTGG